MVELSIECKAQAQAINVDAENRIIRDVIIAQQGEAKGWGYTADDIFLQDFTKQVNGQEKGLRVNFGHNFDNLGKQVGRIRNARFAKGQIKADLHIYASANKLPGMEGTGDWVMQLAREDNEAIMFSIKATLSKLVQKVDGKEVRVNFYDPEEGWIPANPELGPIYMRLSEARAADLVAEGALTEAMFSESELARHFSYIMQHPQLDSYLEANYKDLSKITEFFAGKFDEKPGIVKKAKKIIEFLSTEDAELKALREENEELKTQLEMSKETQAPEGTEELQAQYKALKEENEQLQAQLKEAKDTKEEKEKLEANYAALQKKFDDFEQENAEFLKELQASGATPPDGGTGDQPSESWMNDPINQRAAAFSKGFAQK